MTMFEADQFQWRETYFVLFSSRKRPTLDEIERALRQLGSHYQLTDLQAADDGSFESLTLVSPDDFAALDISYLSGEDIEDQVAALVDEMQPADKGDAAKLKQLKKCDARLDVMHFEQMIDGGGSDEPDEMLDPSTLLIVLDALTELTGGVSIDPQSGSLM